MHALLIGSAAVVVAVLLVMVVVVGDSVLAGDRERSCVVCFCVRLGYTVRHAPTTTI